MKIAFWSNYSGSAVTSNMTAISSVISLLYRLKLTLVSNHFEKQSLGYSVLGKEYDNLICEAGKHYVCENPNFYMRKILSPEVKSPLNGASYDGLENGLYYYFQERFYSDSLIELNYNNNFNRFVDTVAELSDLIFIDCQSQGSLNTLQQLEEADLIVVNLKQDEIAADNFFKRYSSIVPKCFFILSDYRTDGKLQKKNFIKKYKLLSERVAIVPHIAEFAPGVRDGRIPYYVISNINSIKGNPEYRNMWYLKQAARKLMKTVNLFRDNCNYDSNMERITDAEAV